MMRGIGILLILAIGLSGCKTQTQVTENKGEKTDAVEEVRTDMEHAVELMKDAGNLSQDSAQGAMETLYESGAAEVTTAELVSENYGVTLKVTDVNGKVYYLGFGGSGYLEIIRKDSENGEILCAPID